MLLVHGGASPRATWTGLESLPLRWTVVSIYRRGFPPSPPPRRGRQDFEVDADDLAPFLSSRPHLVAHSYGAVGALIAATRRPDLVRSLTLIEPAVFLTPSDPEHARFRRMGEEVLARGLDAPPDTLREFLRIAGAPVSAQGPIPESVAQGVRRAQGSRSPWEARLHLRRIREPGVPCLVASGGHTPFLERASDTLAIGLGAKRLVAPGAGHFVARAPAFAGHLERFFLSTGRARTPG